MHLIFGLFVVAAIIYFAFVRNPNDSTEIAVKKIARLAVALAIVLGVLLYFIITRN